MYISTVYLLCLLMLPLFCLPLVPISIHKLATSEKARANSHPSKTDLNGKFPTRKFSNIFKQLNIASKSSGIEHTALLNSGALYSNVPISASRGPSANFSGSLLLSSAKTSPTLTASTDIDESSLSYDVNTRSVSRNSKRQKTSKNVVNNRVSVKIASMPTEGSGTLQYQHEYSVSNKNDVLKVKLDLKLDSNDNNYEEYTMPSDHQKALQLSVRAPDQKNHSHISDIMLTIGTALVALFSLGLILGIFSCCCKKKQQSDENKDAQKNNKEIAKNEDNAEEDSKALLDVKKPSQVFNTSDIPVGEEDLDDPIPIKDKIKALNNILIIQPSPDHPSKRNIKSSPDPGNRKSQNEVNLTENKAFYAGGMSRQPQIVISQDDMSSVATRDRTEPIQTKSTADNISKSDTQDDISDKIFDNVSMHSSIISQPYNPDVVVADTDEEDEFTDIQRGTVILKSFQRAKPPRNRSPATRTSKGKIRKSRPNLDRSRDKERSQSPKSRSRDNSLDLEPASTASSISLPPSQGTGSKTNSLDKKLDGSKNNSLEKKTENGASNGNKSNESNKKSENLMTKSSNFSDFDSIMNRSVTSISSDIVTQKKQASPTNARYVKNKDSPKAEREVRNESPSRVVKSKEREISERDKRTESPNRFKKNKDSPVNKRKNKKKLSDQEARNSRSDALTTDIREGREVANSSVANRLSGIPSNVNNIFYLIDPTVKNKCKSVDDIISGDEKKRQRRSGDYSRETKAVQNKVKDNHDVKAESQEEAGSPVKRERTQSDPSRISKIMADQSSL